MERLHQFKTKHEKFHITPSTNHLFLYTPHLGSITLHNLQTLAAIKSFKTEPFLTFTCNSHIFLITTKTHISCYNAYTGQKELFMFSYNCHIAHLLSNKKIIHIYNAHIIVYNQYNQEESRYNFDKYKIIKNKIIVFLNNLITVFNEEMAVVSELYVDNIILPVYFSFTLFRNKVVYMNDNTLYGNNVVYKFDWLDYNIVDFDITESFVFLKIKEGFILYDRKENQNINLQISVGLVKDYINPINCERGIVECEMYQVFDKYLVYMKGKLMQSYKELEIGGDFIEGMKTFDYIEAECEFDISDESII